MILPPDTRSDQTDDRRLGRVVGSLLIVGFLGYGMVLASIEESVSPFWGLSTMLGFMLLSGVLIVTISGRLYRQHEIRELKLDLASMILLSALIALPFAASNATWEIFQMQNDEDLQESKTSLLVAITAGYAFLFIPTFFLSEAILTWYGLFFKKRK